MSGFRCVAHMVTAGAVLGEQRHKERKSSNDNSHHQLAGQQLRTFPSLPQVGHIKKTNKTKNNKHLGPAVFQRDT